MNNSQGPPLNYPSSPPPTFKPYRTPNFSRNESPRFRPPAYGAEGAPPLYQEAANIEEENGFKAKKIAVIRILSSIFIAVIIALIVAGVIGKITTMKKHEQDLKNSHNRQSDQGSAKSLMARSKDSYHHFAASAAPVSTSYCIPPIDCSDHNEKEKTSVSETESPCDITLSNRDDHEDDGSLSGSHHAQDHCPFLGAWHVESTEMTRSQCSTLCRRTKLNGEPVRADVDDDWGACG